VPYLSELGEPATLLNCELSTIPGIRKAGWLEQKVLARSLKGEKVDHGPDRHWLDTTWKVRVGSVNSFVFKVAYEADLDDASAATSLAAKAFRAVYDVLGEPEKLKEGMWLWHASDGNAVMQLGTVMRTHMVMLFLTSSAVRHSELQ